MCLFAFLCISFDPHTFCCFVTNCVFFFWIRTSLCFFFVFFQCANGVQVRRMARRANEWRFERPSGKTTAGATHRYVEERCKLSETSRPDMIPSPVSSRHRSPSTPVMANARLPLYSTLTSTATHASASAAARTDCRPAP